MKTLALQAVLLFSPFLLVTFDFRKLCWICICTLCLWKPVKSSVLFIDLFFNYYFFLILTVPPWGFYCPSLWMQTWRSSRSSCFTMLGCRWVQFALPQQLTHVYIHVGLLLGHQKVNQANQEKILHLRRLCHISKHHRCLDWCSENKIYTNLPAAVNHSCGRDIRLSWRCHSVNDVCHSCCGVPLPSSWCRPKGGNHWIRFFLDILSHGL